MVADAPRPRPVSGGRVAEGVRMYGLLAWTWCRAAGQYPVSMVMLTVSQVVFTALDLAALFLIFAHTSRLAGFSLAQVMFFYGTAGMSFSIADIVLGTAERLGEHIRQGTFDAFLVRPVSPLIQLATEDFSPRRLGKLVPTAVVLIVSLPRIGVSWTPVRVLLVPVMVLCGVLIFAAFWIFTAALQFVLVDGREAMNSVTYGGGFLTQYPLSVYGKDFVRGLTWMVPLAFVNWQPSLYVLNRPDPLHLPVFFRFASPLVAVALCALAALAWRSGLRHYRSTGS